MNKYFKVVLTFLTVIVMIISAVLLSMYNYFNDSIVTMKRRTMKDLTISSEYLLNTIIPDLYNSTLVKSFWTDYYNAIRSNDTKWIEENINSILLINENIDFVITTNLEGKAIYGHENFSEYTDTGVGDYILKRAMNGEEAYRGLYQSKQGVALISVAKVYDNYKGHSSGYIICGKLINENYISSIGMINNAKISILPGRSLESITLERNYIVDSQSEGIKVTWNKSTMDFICYKPMPDINGNSLGTLMVKETGSIGNLYNNFVSFKRYMFIIVFLFVIAMLALWAVLINPLSRKLMLERTKRMDEVKRCKNLEEQNLMMKGLAYRDGLTGMFNRRLFDTEVEELIKQKKPFMLMMIDIDDFKIINDSFGHPMGDFVLKGLSQVITEQIRESDLLCRYGGEEFCIILPGCSTDNTETMARRIKEVIQRKQFKLKNMKNNISVTVSIGVSNYSGKSEEDVYNVIDKADRALYDAKRNGKNSITFEIGYNY